MGVDPPNRRSMEDVMDDRMIYEVPDAPVGSPTTSSSLSASKASPTTQGKQFSSSNRATGMRAILADKSGSDVMKALENAPDMIRGDRKLPTLLKYPTEIGSGEIPHVMQFQVFWRWANPDLVETAKSLKTELETIIYTPSPSENSETDSLNLNKARQQLGSLALELKDGVDTIGRVEFDETQKLIMGNRLEADVSRAIEEVSVGGADGVSGVDIGVASGLSAIPAIGPFLAGTYLGYEVMEDDLNNQPNADQATKPKTQNHFKYDQMVSIYLPFCNKINNEDMFQYEEFEAKLAGAAADVVGSNAASTASQATEEGVAKAAALFEQEQVTNALLGSITNPRLAKVFKQKDFRNFSFSWEFFPRNKEEVQMIRDIIETFRYHSHPSKEGGDDSAQIRLRVPAEFRIRFLSTHPSSSKQAGFVENEFLPRIGYCSLTSISVDYTPTGIYSSLEDNSPSAITMSLQFSEMDIMTRDLISKGF